MPLTDNQYRTGAVDFINHYCNRQFEDTAENPLPPGIEVATEILIKAMKENPAVASQSLGDMSKSFFQNGTITAVKEYLRPYRKAGFK
jgi:hypothetical protein